MKWVQRDPWSDAFADILDRHLAPACDKAGVDLAELGNVVGVGWMANLWGCAFEDFLTREFEGIGNVVDAYLARRGWKETVPTRTYLAGLKASVMSLYEVSEVKPGRSFLARDLIRGGEPVQIVERTATRTLKQWDRIAARVVELRGKRVIGVGVLYFDFDLADQALGTVHGAQRRIMEDRDELLSGIDSESLRALFTEALDNAELLRYAAPLFSTVWLFDLLRNRLDPQPLEIVNSDGEEVVPMSLHYDLLAGVTAERVRAALTGVPGLRAESDSFWNWLRPKGTPSPGGAAMRPRTVRLASSMDDGATVLGTVELDGGTLTLQVNSEGRAERGRALLEPALDGLVGEPRVVRVTIDEVVAQRPERGGGDASAELPVAEKRRLVHVAIDRHYHDLLDEPIPALGDLTPRAAAASAEGRPKLVGWLKGVENDAARRAPSDPLAGYDAAWMWEELGVADLRR